MATNKQKDNFTVFPIVIAFVVGAVFLVFIVGVTRNGAGSTVSKASRNTTLTVGDDALSLSQDLKELERNTAEEDEALLDALK